MNESPQFENEGVFMSENVKEIKISMNEEQYKELEELIKKYPMTIAFV